MSMTKPHSRLGAHESPDGGHLPRYPNLDGWRGISILFVLAAHWLPLGPSRWELNAAAGVVGMSLFFSLSGFLITSTLVFHPSVGSFLIRRLARVVPLAWLFLVTVAIVVGLTGAELAAHALFFANIPPYWLTDVTAHLWSLCVEMHFYVAIALLVAVFRRRAFVLVPFLCLALTALRISAHEPVSIFTPFRVDEIASGSWLALCVHRGRLNDLPGKLWRFNITSARLPLWLLCFLLAASSHLSLVALNYFRPYAAALLVGATLTSGDGAFRRLLGSRRLAYVASISYALYVFHPLFSAGWMSSGSDVMKYAKRVPAALLTLMVAHLSTNHYERRWTEWGKRLSSSIGSKRRRTSGSRRP